MAGLFIPKEKLTAYQRWELAAFDEEEAEKAKAGRADATAAKVPEATNEPEPEPAPEEPGIQLPTVEEIERIHNEAHESGYAAGYTAGYAAGQAEGAAEGEARARAEAEHLASLLTHLDSSIEALEQGVGEQLLALSIEISRQILRHSLRVKPELILPVVREAVAALAAHQGHPLLRLHPDDAALVRSQLGEQLAHNNWRIIEDDSLLAGGCRAELGASEIDASLETRWRRVIETLGTHDEWLEAPPAP